MQLPESIGSANCSRTDVASHAVGSAGADGSTAFAAVAAPWVRAEVADGGDAIDASPSSSRWHQPRH